MRWVTSVVVALLIAASWAPAVAQKTDSALSESERQKLYAKLDQEAAGLEHLAGALKTVVKLSRPSVAHIESNKEIIGQSARRKVEEAGSGIVVQHKEKFYVLTNRHVIKDYDLDEIKIRLADGRQFHPRKVWADADTDIGVMEVYATGLTAARMGDSDRVDIGDFVLAMGSPFGLSHSVTFGIVSAKGRRDLKLGGDAGVELQDFIQTDAAINPGNSGGPLFNLRGEVIGINTAIASSSGGNEGIGFTIPIKMAMVVATQLVDKGRVQRAYLGVNLDPQFDFEDAARVGLTNSSGARVTVVLPKSPAEAASIRQGDVVLSFDGVNVDDDNHLINLVSLTPVDKEVAVVIFRDRKPLTIKVKVGERVRPDGK